MTGRQDVLNLLRSWLGKNEADGSYREIIDIYNSFNGKLPRGIKMSYSWAWCACTWSALAIKLGLTNIMPIEISCGFLINEAKKMGCWQENDAFIPRPGDAILYDWNDSGIGDNKAWPDHVGTVNYVNEKSGYMEVIEGNCSDAVKKRTVSINGRFIRGFITPNYPDQEVDSPLIGGKSVDEVAHEVIVGKWGSGEERKRLLTQQGYDYTAVQKRVNDILNGNAAQASSSNQSQSQPVERVVSATCKAKSFDPSICGNYITTENLYCRNDAGTNKRAICVIPKNTIVRNYGYYTDFNGSSWLYISVAIDGVRYTGFCCSKYLKKSK